jgi:hypothetical protein
MRDWWGQVIREKWLGAKGGGAMFSDRASCETTSAYTAASVSEILSTSNIRRAKDCPHTFLPSILIAHAPFY